MKTKVFFSSNTKSNPFQIVKRLEVRSAHKPYVILSTYNAQLGGMQDTKPHSHKMFLCSFKCFSKKRTNFLSLSASKVPVFASSGVEGLISEKINNKINPSSYWNQCFDKGRLKNFVLWFFLNHGEYKTVQLVEQLKNVGFEYATKAGISLGIEDLKIPPKKAILIHEAEEITRETVQQYTRGDITGVERFQRLIDTWHRTSEQLKQEVIDNFEATDILNPVYMMAFSGARGNISQVRQLVGMRGLMANPQGQIIDFPIRSNFREGLTLTEYIISSYGARKGIVDTALRTANAGYLTRRLVDVAQHVIISNFDCGTRRGIFLSDMKEGNKTILSLQTRLVGRVCARDINVNGEKIAKRNSEISIDLAYNISKVTKKVFVRSALTCETKKLVCQLCYGWSLAQGNLVAIGEAIGVIAAQSIGEPGTQLTMRTFHTGGVFSGDISDQIRMPFNGILNFDSPIPGTLIRTSEGKIAFLTKSSGSFTVLKVASTHGQNTTPIQKKFKIPEYTLLFVRHGEFASEKEVVAQISSISKQKNATDDAELTIKSEIEGEFYLQRLRLKEIQVGPKLSQKDQKKFNASISSPLKGMEMGSNPQKGVGSMPDTSQTDSVSHLMEVSPMDSIFTSWNWGNAWILSGKVYQSPQPSIFFPQIGDYLNKKSSIVISNTNNSFSNISGLVKLKSHLALPVYHFEFLSFQLSSIIYKKFGYFTKLNWSTKSSFVKQKALKNGILTKNDSIFVIPPNGQVLLKKNLMKLYPSNWQSNFIFAAQWFPSLFQTNTSNTLVLEKISMSGAFKKNAMVIKPVNIHKARPTLTRRNEKLWCLKEINFVTKIKNTKIGTFKKTDKLVKRSFQKNLLSDNCKVNFSRILSIPDSPANPKGLEGFTRVPSDSLNRSLNLNQKANTVQTCNGYKKEVTSHEIISKMVSSLKNKQKTKTHFLTTTKLNLVGIPQGDKTHKSFSYFNPLAKGGVEQSTLFTPLRGGKKSFSFKQNVAYSSHNRISKKVNSLSSKYILIYFSKEMTKLLNSFLFLEYDKKVVTSFKTFYNNSTFSNFLKQINATPQNFLSAKILISNNNETIKPKSFQNQWVYYVPREKRNKKRKFSYLMKFLNKLVYPGQLINSELSFDQHIVSIKPFLIPTPSNELNNFQNSFVSHNSISKASLLQNNGIEWSLPPNFQLENLVINNNCRFQKQSKCYSPIAFKITKVDEFFINSLDNSETRNLKNEISQLNQFNPAPTTNLVVFRNLGDPYVSKRLINRSFSSLKEKSNLKNCFVNKQKISPEILPKYPGVDFQIIPYFSFLKANNSLLVQKPNLGSFELGRQTDYKTSKNIRDSLLYLPSNKKSQSLFSFFIAFQQSDVLSGFKTKEKKDKLVYPFKEYKFDFSPPLTSSYLSSSAMGLFTPFKGGDNMSTPNKGTYSQALYRLNTETKNTKRRTLLTRNNLTLLNLNSVFKSPILSSSLIHNLETPFSNNAIYKKTNKIPSNKEFLPFAVKYYVNPSAKGQYSSSLVPFSKTYSYSPFEGEVLHITSPFHYSSFNGSPNPLSRLKSLTSIPEKESGRQTVKRIRNSLKLQPKVNRFYQLIEKESSFLKIKQHTCMILTKSDLISFYLPLSNLQLRTSSPEGVQGENLNHFLNPLQSYVVKPAFVTLSLELMKKLNSEVENPQISEAEAPLNKLVYKLPHISSGFPKQGVQIHKLSGAPYPPKGGMWIISKELRNNTKGTRSTSISSKISNSKASLIPNKGWDKKESILNRTKDKKKQLNRIQKPNKTNFAFLLGDFIVSGDSLLLHSNSLKESFKPSAMSSPVEQRNTIVDSYSGKKMEKELLKTAVTKSGQIIHLNKEKVTLRKGQPLFVSPKSILHKFNGDFIEPKSPVITLSYQRLKTGDIVQGIPKIEQFLEARTTKRGRLFRDSLPNLVKALYKRYRQKFPLDKAVRQSFYKIQQIIVDGVLRVYRSQGVTIADKHLEIIVKQMTSKVRILEGGQTGFFPGEIVDLEFVEQVNELLMKKIQYEPLVLGITKSSLEVDSFLSAASFQQTTRVLSGAAISRKKDFLKGLKENVILGNLIPAGTGYLVYLNDFYAYPTLINQPPTSTR
jgi:hypothetical protein